MFTLCCHHLGDLNSWNCTKRWRNNWFGTEAQRYLLTQDFASTSQPSGEKQKLYKKLKWSVSPCFWRSLLQKTKGGRREQGAPLDKLPSSSQWNLHLELIGWERVNDSMKSNQSMNGRFTRGLIALPKR